MPIDIQVDGGVIEKLHAIKCGSNMLCQIKIILKLI